MTNREVIVTQTGYVFMNEHFTLDMLKEIFAALELSETLN